MYTYMSYKSYQEGDKTSLEKYYEVKKQSDADEDSIEYLELAVIVQDFLMHINSPHSNPICICDKCSDYQRRISQLDRSIKN